MRACACSSTRKQPWQRDAAAAEARARATDNAGLASLLDDLGNYGEPLRQLEGEGGAMFLADCKAALDDGEELMLQGAR